MKRGKGRAMSTSLERHIERVVSAHGYRGSTFTGARVVRLRSTTATRYRDTFVLVLDNDKNLIDAVAELDPTGKFEIVDSQDFSVTSTTGPVVLYERVVDPTVEVPEPIEASLHFGDSKSATLAANAVERAGPFSHDAQIAEHLPMTVFGLRTQITVDATTTEIVSITLASDAQDATAEVQRFLSRRYPEAATQRSAFEVDDTTWTLPNERVSVFIAKSRPLKPMR